MKFIVLLFFLLSCSQLPPKRTDRLSILQGVTNTHSVELSIVAPKNKTLKVELRNEAGEIKVPEEVEVETRDFSPYAVTKVLFARDPKQDYNLYVFEGDALLDQRLLGRGQKNRDRLKLAVVSCSDDYYSKNFGIWDELARKNPEYLLMIGDNVYADKKSSNLTGGASPELLWNRYVDVRMSLPIYFEQKLIPTHGLWDDHDYGKNDGNEKYEYKDQSKEIFETFFAQDLSEDDWEPSFGVGGLLSLGDFNLYFLDGRSFRAPHPEGKHLGLEQEKWLMGKLAEEMTPSLLIKGDQFFGGYHRFESFQGNHPQNFVTFTDELKRLKTPVVFLSGDRHMSEIMQFPRSLFAKPSFEITSSPIHATMFPDNNDENPWRVVANKSKFNFTMISNIAKENHWFMEVENIGEHGETIYRREIAVYIKDLQNNLNEVRKRRGGRRSYRRSRPRRRRK
jgi:alkaline phosphatase D